MAREVLAILQPEPGDLYLDGTTGGGGHARLILSASPECRLIGSDLDPRAIEEASHSLAQFGERVRLVHGNFADLADDHEVRDSGLAGAFLDLGVSSRQLDEPERGFTFARGAPLDMRMNQGAPGRCSTSTAAALLARSTRHELVAIFRQFGEFPRAGALAAAVARRCSQGRMETSDDLVAAVALSLGRSPSAKEKAKAFQAVRIAVNDELGSLTRGLESIRSVLLADAVFVVIAYHSLEDRLVKRAFREWSRGCVCPTGLPQCACGRTAAGSLVFPKPLRPSKSEVERNPRARSARLRAWKRAA